MKKIAIFTEGQSDLIFVRNLLLLLFDNAKLSFYCQRLYRNQLEKVPYAFPNEHAEVYFLIVNAGNDEKVLSAINDRLKNLKNRGYEKVIGLRDMFCEIYQKKSPNIISEDLNNQITDAANNYINNVMKSKEVVIYFSIMEFEAWLLSMYNLFQKINARLTAKYIEDELGYHLKKIDPQRQFYQPAKEVDNIFKLLGGRYKKKESEIESICSKIDNSDIKAAMSKNRCASFAAFFTEISTISPTSLVPNTP